MADGKWLEISLTVDGELAEAVAEVLARHTPGGVAIESTAIVADAEDEGHATGPLRVCGYLPVNAQLEETRRRLEEGLWYLGRISPLPAARYQWVQEADWAEAWKQHYHPILIGRRLVIVPAWLESPDPGRIAVRMDPGMAFGTGTHPTTQLCLELIEAALADMPPAGEPVDMLDMGCGSGILAVAALKLGARRALGVDIDAEAVPVAQQNAALNGVLDRFAVGQGSVHAVLAASFAFRQAALVTANILAPVIVRLFGDGLADLVSPGGVLILSGILADQAGEVEAAAEAKGLTLYERRQEGDWVALGFKSASANAPIQGAGGDRPGRPTAQPGLPGR
jgi:ribosomal protein L11 methyltransferase